MSTRVGGGIVGATGYTGSELVRLLSMHPLVEITVLVSRSEAGKPIATLLPHLYGLPLPELTLYDPDMLAERCEVVFLAGKRASQWSTLPISLRVG